ncbi:MAG: RNA polymerase sigma factor [Peptococcaceae bacterium]|jgi:RNA polymerase sigma-70 factor (ECF subfamily)|nr:RNA polymerase sigma factor [Peptococcaceae bacterium]
MTEGNRAADREILGFYNRGDREQALRLFIDEYQPRLYTLAYRMMGNHDDAMDALQEILIQVNRSLSTFKGDSALYTWAYRLGSNVCLNYRRRKKPAPVEWDEEIVRSVMRPVERPNEDPDQMCETRYKQFLVRQAVLKLPETQRVILVLHDLEGVSSTEIARILDVNAGAVKARLHRGRNALRKIISRGFAVKGMEGAGMFSVGPSGRLL